MNPASESRVRILTPKHRLDAVASVQVPLAVDVKLNRWRVGDVHAWLSPASFAYNAESPLRYVQLSLSKMLYLIVNALLLLGETSGDNHITQIATGSP